MPTVHILFLGNRAARTTRQVKKTLKKLRRRFLCAQIGGCAVRPYRLSAPNLTNKGLHAQRQDSIRAMVLGGIDVELRRQVLAIGFARFLGGGSANEIGPSPLQGVAFPSLAHQLAPLPSNEEKPPE